MSVCVCVCENLRWMHAFSERARPSLLSHYHFCFSPKYAIIINQSYHTYTYSAQEATSSELVCLLSTACLRTSNQTPITCTPTPNTSISPLLLKSKSKIAISLSATDWTMTMCVAAWSRATSLLGSVSSRV